MARDQSVTRRSVLGTTSLAAVGTVAVAATALASPTASADAIDAPESNAVPPPDYSIQRGRIHHSVMGWCFQPLPVEELINACHKMGMTAMEGIDPKYYPRLRELGMKPSLVSSHGFAAGPTSRDNHAEVVASLRKGIDLAVEFGAPGVITFTGMRVKGISDEQMITNCLDAWQEVIGYAEQHGVNLCLEHLNSRDDTHPMKGHPGYFGDHLDFCAELVRRMDSPRMKLLFDIYHVQIMDGDLIRRLRQHIDIIGHIHTAGVPGRGELDDRQEINYPAVMKSLISLGYEGFTAHEFIPTWPDPLAALRHAVSTCDV